MILARFGTERTREIGLEKAIGAKHRISSEFLIEPPHNGFATCRASDRWGCDVFNALFSV